MPALSSVAFKRLCLVAERGSTSDVDLAIERLKESGGDINAKDSDSGLAPLHIATRRNHIPIIRRLLAAGADPNVKQEGPSGWSTLHRALYLRRLAVASVLLQFDASLFLEDSKSYTPLDFLSGPVRQVIGDTDESVTTEVFSWGSGVSNQQGTGSIRIQKTLCKVRTLHGSSIKSVSAAKFHSVAVTVQGEVFTWGTGREGQLGTLTLIYIGST